MEYSRRLPTVSSSEYELMQFNKWLKDVGVSTSVGQVIPDVVPSVPPEDVPLDLEMFRRHLAIPRARCIANAKDSVGSFEPDDSDYES